MIGKALLVPVDSGSIGTSPHAAAVTRAVPSPPRQTITRAPASIIIRTVAVVSAALCVCSRGPTKLTSGHAW